MTVHWALWVSLLILHVACLRHIPTISVAESVLNATNSTVGKSTDFPSKLPSDHYNRGFEVDGINYSVNFWEFRRTATWNGTAVITCIDETIQQVVSLGPQIWDLPVLVLNTDCVADGMYFGYRTGDQAIDTITWRVWMATLKIIRAFVGWYDHVIFTFEVYEQDKPPWDWGTAPIEGRVTTSGVSTSWNLYPQKVRQDS